VREFLKTYIFALVILLVVGFTISVALRAFGEVSPDYDAPRPTPAQLASYVLRFQVDGEAFRSVDVATDGAQCELLAQSSFLRKACVLALNQDPTFIAGEAFGDLNNRDTPAYEAIIWRARLDRDPQICDRGGLLGARLARCREVAVADTYDRKDGDLRVMIGIQGASQSPSG
jgi:hypothetical protein